VQLIIKVNRINVVSFKYARPKKSTWAFNKSISNTINYQKIIAMKKSAIKPSEKCTSVFSVFNSFTVVRLLVIILCFSSALKSFSQNPTKTFAAGSYIIDMGQSNQTIENGLKPYGLVYELLIVEGIPVCWAINSSKSKDGTDFIADGKDYKGGSFILAGERITGSVMTIINTWRAKGVMVDGPTAGSFTAPVYQELTSWPIAVLDAQNDALITPYYNNAEIPTSSYILHANPSMLSGCGGGDMYVLPHADPDTWDLTDILWLIILRHYINNGGYLWAGCHAVSVLENLPGCNFLSNDGLVHFKTPGHSNGTPPYTYLPSSDAYPIMQFIGNLDNATQTGSEQIFVPGVAGWRNTTSLAVYDPNYVNTTPDPDVAYTYPEAATLIAYGPAFGDNNKGTVMYEAGHTLNTAGTIAQRVAAQRAYFNFVLMAGVQKKISVDFDLTTFPEFLTPGVTEPLSATVIGGTPPYTYLWSSDGGGTFSSDSTNPTSYTAPLTIGNIVIKLKVTDACGRANFLSVVMNQGSTVQCLSDAIAPVPPSGLKDNCNNTITFTPSSPAYVDDPDPLTCEGTRIFSWTYKDYTSCPNSGAFTRIWKYKYVINDTLAPVVPANGTSTVECIASVVAPTTPVVIDNCGATIPAVLVNAIDTPNPLVSEGTRVYTYSYTDCAGNASSWKYTYTVEDTLAPVISGCPSNIIKSNDVGQCNAIVNWTEPTVTDNCTPSTSLVWTKSHTPGSTFPVGITIVTYKATDPAGNISDTCSFIVTVTDNTPPVPLFTILPTVTGECSATVSSTPTATDNCAGTVTGTTSDPLTYTEQGTFTITWKFDDGNGNTSAVAQKVIVDDVTAPVAPEIIADATGECSVTVTAPATTDNCVGTVTGTTSDPLTYTEQGTFTVTWTFDDRNGNSSTATQKVIVDDVTAPVAPEVIADATGECSVTVTAPATTDNCVGAVTGTTSDPLTYTEQGTFTVNWTFDDRNGNTSAATQKVIVDDVTAPVAPEVIADATGECSVTVTTPTATDNCVGTVTGTTSEPLTYSTQGNFSITWTFDDGNGNMSTKTQKVVVNDVTIPVISCPANITKNAEPGVCEANVSVPAPVTSDNCGVTLVVNSFNNGPDATGVYPVGTTTVLWNVTDVNGNLATCSLAVTVTSTLVAVDDYASTQMNTAVDINMLANDKYCDNNIDPSTVLVVVSAQHGTVVIDPATGLATYTPTLNYSGSDSYDYKVCDFDGNCSTATVHITVETGNVNHPPIAVDDKDTTLVNTPSPNIDVLANDSDPDGDQLTVSICGQPSHGTIILNENQTFTYTPDKDYTGPDEFCYTICDNGIPSLCSSAKVNITIVPDLPRDEIEIYNTFTPNGDGKNDTWWIKDIEEYTDNEVIIFNRWGDEVWSTQNYDNKSPGVWAGKNKRNENLPDATYFYIIKLKSPDKVFSGWVMIHR